MDGFSIAAHIFLSPMPVLTARDGPRGEGLLVVPAQRGTIAIETVRPSAVGGEAGLEALIDYFGF